VSEFVYAATSSFALLENQEIITREQFKEVSDNLAKDVFNTFIEDKANFTEIINQDVNSAVIDLKLPRWGWAGTFGDGFPIFLFGLGQNVVEVGGASTFEYLANLAKVLIANNYAFNTAVAVSSGKFIGNVLHESYQASLIRANELAQILDIYQDSDDESSCPIILDLDGDGVETLNMADSSIYFDHNRDGFAQRTGWAGADDGILVRDLNGNGQIDNDHLQTSSYTTTDGQVREAHDVWFATNRSDSVQLAQIEVPDNILAMINLQGMGTLPSLHNAMVMDTTVPLITALTTEYAKAA